MNTHESPVAMGKSPPSSTPDPTMPTLRGVRRFDPDRPVPTAILERILSLARYAPSGYDLQPWRFLVVREPGNRRRLRACAYGQRRLGEAPVHILIIGYMEPDRTHLDSLLDGEVCRGVISADEAAYRRGLISNAMRRESRRDLWAARSASTAATALLRAADSLGVAAAWIDAFDAEKLRESFGIPDDHVLCALLALGYALDAVEPPERLALEEVCYAEHFGQPWLEESPERARWPSTGDTSTIDPSSRI